MTDKEKELLKKIKALADKGIGGEKIAAEKKLKQLMQKFDITEDELEINVNGWYEFKLKKDKFLNKLFYQILFNIYDVEKQNVQCIKNSKYDINLHIPANIAIELATKYEFYCEAFNKDLETFYIAFINSNELWSCGDPTDDLTEEEQEQRLKATQLANFLDKHNFNKQLEYKGGSKQWQVKRH